MIRTIITRGKGFSSFILQGLVDNRLRFQNINVSWPGRIHDARVLTSSALYLKAQVGSLVPRATNVNVNVNLPSTTGSACAITQARGS